MRTRALGRTGWSVGAGTKKPRYLADNAAAADLDLTADDLATLNDLPPVVGDRY